MPDKDPLIKLSIHHNPGSSSPLSYSYEIKVGRWKLADRVTAIDLKMVANEKPKLTITCYPDSIDIDADVLAKINDVSKR